MSFLPTPKLPWAILEMSKVNIFHGVHTEEKVNQVPRAIRREGFGAFPLKKFLILAALKIHFPCYPGNSFINLHMDKREVFSNFCYLLVNLWDDSRIKGKG